MSGRALVVWVLAWLVPLAAAFVLLVLVQGGEEPPLPVQGGADSGNVLIETVLPSPRAAPSPSPLPGPGLLLPDLRTTDPGVIFVNTTAAGREIRFSTTVENHGRGPLKLTGVIGRSGTAVATQHIQRSDNTVIEVDAGTLELSPTHGHWHLREFATFELWSYRTGGELDSLLATTGKITFCLLDYTPIEPEPEVVAAGPEFVDCNWRQQGISEGWSETYDASLPGQQLDITGVPDGRYAMRTTLDPEDRLRESDETNNSNIVYVELSRGSIALLPAP